MFHVMLLYIQNVHLSKECQDIVNQSQKELEKGKFLKPIQKHKTSENTTEVEI